jgi:hypothetical protein
MNQIFYSPIRLATELWMPSISRVGAKGTILAITVRLPPTGRLQLKSQTTVCLP